MFPMDKFFIYVPEIRGEQILKNKKSFLAGSIAWVSYFVNITLGLKRINT